MHRKPLRCAAEDGCAAAVMATNPQIHPSMSACHTALVALTAVSEATCKVRPARRD